MICVVKCVYCCATVHTFLRVTHLLHLALRWGLFFLFFLQVRFWVEKQVNKGLIYAMGVQGGAWLRQGTMI